MTSKKHLFELPVDIHYLNSAYMAPLLKSTYEAGVAGMKRKLNPSGIHVDDFFSLAEDVKLKFGKMIHAPAQQIAVIPSASYGLKSAVNNIPLDTGNQAIGIGNEFPSDYYTIKQWCKQNKKNFKVIEAPQQTDGRGEAWTDRIVEEISEGTAVVILSTIHWADGTKFDLKKIGEKCQKSNAMLIADGTQSVGALPIDVMAFKIDALICAAYKWLLGPYSIGLAYYSEKFNDGIPIEDSWMNRTNANDFTTLTRYVDDYKPGAARYNVGEYSNYILLPMLDGALQQIDAWGVDTVQEYCGKLMQPLTQYLRQNGYWVEGNEYRANHLLGFSLPKSMNKDALFRDLQNRKVFVSVRGDGIRVSLHVYNDEKDIGVLIETLEKNKS